MRVVAVVLALLVIPAVALAQPSLTAPVEPCPYPTTDTPTIDPDDLKSESVATLLALGTTAAGFATMYAAADSKIDGMAQVGALLVLIGPSAGHIYAGETKHAVRMSLLRTAGVGIMMLGVVSMFSAGSDCIDCGHSDNTGEKLLIAGGLTFAIATAYDIYDAHRAVRRSNERMTQQQRMWMLAPSAVAASSGGVAPALALSGRF
jgi:hypothetical protein